MAGYRGGIGLEQLSPELQEKITQLINGDIGNSGTPIHVSEGEPIEITEGEMWFQVIGENTLPPSDGQITVIMANAVITDDEPEDTSGKTIWLDPTDE